MDRRHNLVLAMVYPYRQYHLRQYQIQSNPTNNSLLIIRDDAKNYFLDSSHTLVYHYLKYHYDIQHYL